MRTTDKNDLRDSILFALLAAAFTALLAGSVVGFFDDQRRIETIDVEHFKMGPR
jgi:hypothetical protein